MAEKELFPQLSLLTQNTSPASASGTLIIAEGSAGGLNATTSNAVSKGSLVITGKAWLWYNSGEFIEVNSDAVFYYDILYSCTGTNRHLFGFEKYDANKTVTSNNSCVYPIDSTSTFTNRRVSGFIDLSKDLNGKPTKYIRPRVLNEWNHSINQNTDVLTIQRFSLIQLSKENITKITKTTQWITDIISENEGDWVPIRASQFGAHNSGTQSVTNGDVGISYNITSPVITNSNWGSGRCLLSGQFILPYGYNYKVRMAVRIPTAHYIAVDHNNDPESGSNWQGNDNDLCGARTVNYFSIPANTWITIEWGGTNAHPLNVNHVNLLLRDGFGVVTKDDNAAVTWEMRNPQIKIYKDTNTNFSIGKDGTTHANQIYEI